MLSLCNKHSEITDLMVGTEMGKVSHWAFSTELVPSLALVSTDSEFQLKSKHKDLVHNMR